MKHKQIEDMLYTHTYDAIGYQIPIKTIMLNPLVRDGIEDPLYEELWIQVSETLQRQLRDL